VTSGKIEREFGVPVPGVILPREQWAQTGLKRLPRRAEGTTRRAGGVTPLIPLIPLIDWSAVFGRAAPLIVDLGCGNGRFLLASALLRPELNHVGVDVLPLVIRYATRRGNQRGLHHLRFAVCDAERFLLDYVGPGAAREIHCYHPQPYYEPADFHKRLLTPRFLARMHERLEPGGKFFVQTDHPGYWRYIQEAVPAFFEFTEQRGPWPGAPKGRTRREIIALRRGLPVFRGWGVRRDDLTANAIAHLVATLPLPDFEADRTLLELDMLERGE
jgi:tRNA (guanine-N7-)-methyltransferase